MSAKKIMIGLFLSALSSTLYAEEVQEHQKHLDEIIHLSDKVIHRYEINIATAGPEILQVTREVLGKITPNANKTFFIYPRYSGIIKKMTKNLGDKVKKDELLAEIESNKTLQLYSINAPFSGYIVRKKANIGEFVKTESPIYQLADLSSVWVDLLIYRKNANLIKKGQEVIVFNDNIPEKKVTSNIDYVSPLGIEQNQTMLARTVLANDVEKLTWLPGLYVNARIVIEKKHVSVAVKNSAIQVYEGKKVIFIKIGNQFIPKACEFGIEGETYTEVLNGITAGEQYVADNSFVLKAELEKENVSHSH